MVTNLNSGRSPDSAFISSFSELKIGTWDKILLIIIKHVVTFSWMVSGNVAVQHIFSRV
jgi:hypothetical protein